MRKDKYLTKIKGASPRQEKIIKEFIGMEYNNLAEIYNDLGEDFHDYVTLEEFIKTNVMYNNIFIEIFLADMELTFKIDNCWLILWDFTCYED